MTFARFVEWSPQEFPSASAPIVVGIVADEAVAVALETIARGKNVAGRTIAVKRLQWDSDDRRRAHALCRRDRRSATSGSCSSGSGPARSSPCPRLPEFGRAGGMITLTFTDGRISFAVNSRATAVERGASQLLPALARHQGLRRVGRWRPVTPPCLLVHPQEADRPRRRQRGRRAAAGRGRDHRRRSDHVPRHQARRT